MVIRVAHVDVAGRRHTTAVHPAKTGAVCTRILWPSSSSSVCYCFYRPTAKCPGFFTTANIFLTSVAGRNIIAYVSTSRRYYAANQSGAAAAGPGIPTRDGP